MSSERNLSPRKNTASIMSHNHEFLVCFEILLYAIVLHGSFYPNHVFLMDYEVASAHALCPGTDQVRGLGLLPILDKAISRSPSTSSLGILSILTHLSLLSTRVHL